MNVKITCNQPTAISHISQQHETDNPSGRFAGRLAVSYSGITSFFKPIDRRYVPDHLMNQDREQNQYERRGNTHDIDICSIMENLGPGTRRIVTKLNNVLSKVPNPAYYLVKNPGVVLCSSLALLSRATAAPLSSPGLSANSTGQTNPVNPQLDSTEFQDFLNGSYHQLDDSGTSYLTDNDDLADDFSHGINGETRHKTSRNITDSLSQQCFDNDDIHTLSDNWPDGWTGGEVHVRTRDHKHARDHGKETVYDGLIFPSSDQAINMLCNDHVSRTADKLMEKCADNEDDLCRNYQKNKPKGLKRRLSLTANMSIQNQTALVAQMNPEKNNSRLILTKWNSDSGFKNNPAVIVDLNNNASQANFTLYQRGIEAPCYLSLDDLPEVDIKFNCVDHCNNSSCKPIPCEKFWYASQVPYYDGENFHVLTSPYHDENQEATVNDLSDKRLGEWQVNPERKILKSANRQEQRLLNKLFKELEKTRSRLTDESIYSATQPADVLTEKGWELAFTNLGFDFLTQCGGYQLFRHSVRENMPFFAISNPVKSEIKLFFYDESEATNMIKVCLSEAQMTRGIGKIPIDYNSKAFHNGQIWTDKDVEEYPSMCTVVKKPARPHWGQVNFNPLYDPYMENTTRVDLVVEFLPTNTFDLLLTASAMGKSAGLHQFDESAAWFPSGDETEAELESKFDELTTQLNNLAHIYTDTQQNGQIDLEGDIYRQGGREDIQNGLHSFSGFAAGFSEIVRLFGGTKGKMLETILKGVAEVSSGIADALPETGDEQPELKAIGSLAMDHAIPTWFTSLSQGTGSGSSTFRSSQVRVSYPGSSSLEKGVRRGPLESLPSYTQTQPGLVGFISAPKAQLTAKATRTFRSGNFVEGEMNCRQQKISRHWGEWHEVWGLPWDRYQRNHESQKLPICLPTVYKSTRANKIDLAVHYRISGYNENSIALNPTVASEVENVSHHVKFSVSWDKYKHHGLLFSGNANNRYIPCHRGRPRSSWMGHTPNRLYRLGCGNDQVLSHIGSYEPVYRFTETTNLHRKPSYWQPLLKFEILNGLREFYTHRIGEQPLYSSTNRPYATERILPASLSPAYSEVAFMPNTRAALGAFHADITDGNVFRPVPAYDNPLSPGSAEIGLIPLNQTSNLRFRLMATNENCTQKCNLADFTQGITIYHQLVTNFTRNGIPHTFETAPAPLLVEDIT